MRWQAPSESAKPTCEKCWDKGYATRLWGGGIVRGDFLFDDSFHIPIQLEINPCGCTKFTKKMAIEIAKKEHEKLGIEYRPILATKTTPEPEPIESAKLDWRDRFEKRFDFPVYMEEMLNEMRVGDTDWNSMYDFIDRELKAARLEGLQAARRALSDACYFNDDKNLNEYMYRKGVNDAAAIALSSVDSLIEKHD